MYYDVEMLRLYFKEKGFTKQQIDKLLDRNPFNTNFTIWKKQTINNNKTFAITLKKYNIINQDTPIQEIVVHEDNSVSDYLKNNSIKVHCSINEDINKLKLYNNLILFKGLYDNEDLFLKKIYYRHIPFVTGICSKDYNYYIRALKLYKSLLKEINCELWQYKNENQHILILKNKRMT